MNLIIMNLVIGKLLTTNLSLIVNTCSDVKESWSKWQQAIHNIIEASVPKVVLSDIHKVPWYDRPRENSTTLKDFGHSLKAKLGVALY